MNYQTNVWFLENNIINMLVKEIMYKFLLC